MEGLKVRVDRAGIGLRTPPYAVDVEAGQLKFFAKATGETNLVYSDEVAARAAGHRALPAPPSFTFCLASHTTRVLEEDLGVDMRRILHGEQSFQHHRLIYAGDRLSISGEVVDIYERKGGALEFIVQRTSIINQDGLLCSVSDMTTVVRGIDPQ